MSRLRALYGATPLHLIAVAASFAIAGYAIIKIAGGADAGKVLLWLLAAVVLHDLILFPLYTGLDRVAQGRRPSAAVNFVRFPAVISAVLFAISAGLIVSASPGSYESATGLRPEPYLERWLAITAALFLTSGLLYALRARRTSSAAPRGVSPPHGAEDQEPGDGRGHRPGPGM